MEAALGLAGAEQNEVFFFFFFPGVYPKPLAIFVASFGLRFNQTYCFGTDSLENGEDRLGYNFIMMAGKASCFLGFHSGDIPLFLHRWYPEEPRNAGFISSKWLPFLIREICLALSKYRRLPMY